MGNTHHHDVIQWSESHRNTFKSIVKQDRVKVLTDSFVRRSIWYYRIEWGKQVRKHIHIALKQSFTTGSSHRHHKARSFDSSNVLKAYYTVFVSGDRGLQCVLVNVPPLPKEVSSLLPNVWRFNWCNVSHYVAHRVLFRFGIMSRSLRGRQHEGWHVREDVWGVTCEGWRVRGDMWGVTCERWQVSPCRVFWCGELCFHPNCG